MNQADLAIKNHALQTALHLAVHDQSEGTLRGKLAEEVHRSKEAVLKSLLTHMRAEDIALQDHTGRTPLHMSISWLSPETLALFWQRMSHEELQRQDRNGETILHAICKRPNETNLMLLLQHDIDIKIKNKQGQTGLLHAIERPDSIKIVRLLLAHGAEAGAADNDEWTGLHSAVEDKNHVPARLLIEAGAPVNCAVASGWTPLHSAVVGGDHALAKLLIDSGTPVNCATATGWTPLHFATADTPDFTALPRLLIEAGADINKLAGKKTVLHFAVYASNAALVESLLSHGADPLLIDNFGRSCLDWASILGNKVILELVLSFCKDASLTKHTIVDQRLKHNISTLLQDSTQEGKVHVLHCNEIGHCLTLLGDAREAKTAFEQITRYRELATSHGRDDRSLPTSSLQITHDHVHCNACSFEEPLEGVRFVCCTCPDMDFCETCMERYATEILPATCQNHQFLRIPGEELWNFGDGKINQEGETREQWRDRLILKYAIPEDTESA